MNFAKKTLTALLTAALACTMFAGCGGTGGASSAAPSENPAASQEPAADPGSSSAAAPAPAGDMKIEIVAKGFQHDFWKAVRTGAEKAGGEFGATINFVGPDNESAIAQQVEMIKNAINKKPTAICLAALDTMASLEAISTAQTNKIPIIGFDSGVPGAPDGAIAANAATDNYAAGEMAAEKMFDAIKDKLTAAAAGSAVRIGVVAQESNSDSINQRTGGFVDKMVNLTEDLPEYGPSKVGVTGHDKYSNKVADAKVVIEVRIPTEVSDNAGKTEASTLLNKEDLIAIYGSNEFAAKCIINANESLKKLGTDKVLAVGFDSGALQMDAIKNGTFYGSVTQDPVSIGYQAVKLAVAAAKGEAVSDVDTGCQWYNSENMEAPEIAPCLYK